MEKLTIKQNKIMDYISDHIEENGYPPTIREIGKEVELKSSATVAGHLNRLVRKGYIKKKCGIPRSISIVKQ